MARLHVYVLLAVADQYDAVLARCRAYLAAYENDVVLLMYESEALFALERFQDCVGICDRIIALCSTLQAAESRRRPAPAPKEPKIRERRPQGLYYKDRPRSIAEIKSQAYMNKGLGLACLRQYDQAIAMTQWALFHHRKPAANRRARRPDPILCGD